MEMPRFDEVTNNALAELRALGVKFATDDQLREAGVLYPKGAMPPTAFSFGPADALSILKGESAFGPGVPLPQPNPLANYPPARQPGESFGDFVDRSGSPGAMVPALMQALPPGLSAFAAGMMPTPAGGQNAPTEATRQLQTKLKDLGYFPWKVDGIAGEKTDAANARYQADQRAAKQQEIDALAAQGRINEANAKAAEQERLRVEGERTAANRAAGEARMKEIGGQTFLEQWGPMAGLIGGSVIGGLS